MRNDVTTSSDRLSFGKSEMGTFDEPWAAAFEPTTGSLFVTERKGVIKFVQTNGEIGDVQNVPKVDYGGQGGLGDIAFAPDYPTSGMVYLSWAEAGRGDTRGAVVGRAKLDCDPATRCALGDMQVIWRQTPKVTGRGHYSHRIAFSPDGRYLYLASGDRQKMQPAQDLSNNLGTVLRLNLDGTPASGNPFADRGGVSREIWSYGHRNILGLAFDGSGQLWDLEHGPKGGDELNRVERGENYGWPLVSDGVHYDGGAIPDHSTRPDLAAPAIGWTPVIAPGDMIFYDGSLFPGWRGDALIAGLKTEALIEVDMNGGQPIEEARYDFGTRLRDVIQGPDGAVWVLGDGDNARLWKLTPG